VRGRIIAAVTVTLVLLGFGGAAAFAAGSPDGQPVAEPTLAQTGYDFTPMLVTAAVFLLIAGITVVVAKYAVARSSNG